MSADHDPPGLAPPLTAYIAAAAVVFDQGWRDLNVDDVEFLLHTNMVTTRAMSTADVQTAGALTRGQLEAALRETLTDVADGLGAEIAAAFGTSTATRGLPRMRRREHAAEARGYVSATSARYWKDRYQRGAIELLGSALYRLEMRAAREVMAHAGDPLNVIAIEWLRRHEYYYDIWTPMWAIHADLIAYTRERQAGAGADTDRFVRSSLYFFSWMLLALMRFQRDRGGLWVLDDPIAEQEAADVLYAVILASGLSTEDQSWLRTKLAESGKKQEMVAYWEQLIRGPRTQDICQKWHRFLRSCLCTPTRVQDSCRVHSTIRHAKRYCDLIDEDW